MTPTRTWIFPAVIVAALIWLALETLGSSSNDDSLRFSDALALVRQDAGSIDHVTFHPSSQEVDFRLTSGKTRRSAYPVDQSAYELQQLLESKGVAFEARRNASSPLWSLVTSLLPFVLLFGFWIFLMNSIKRKPAET